MKTFVLLFSSKRAANSQIHRYPSLRFTNPTNARRTPSPFSPYPFSQGRYRGIRLYTESIRPSLPTSFSAISNVHQLRSACAFRLVHLPPATRNFVAPSTVHPSFPNRRTDSLLRLVPSPLGRPPFGNVCCRIHSRRSAGFHAFIPRLTRSKRALSLLEHRREREREFAFNFHACSPRDRVKIPQRRLRNEHVPLALRRALARIWTNLRDLFGYRCQPLLLRLRSTCLYHVSQLRLNANPGKLWVTVLNRNWRGTLLINTG